MRCAATVVSLLAVLTVFAPPVAAAGEPKLEGSYSVTGVNPDGTEYEGRVKIIRRGNTFLVSWMAPRVSDEGVEFVLTAGGVGIARGGMLAVSFYGQDATGVVLYQIEEHGERLTGEWVSVNDAGGARHVEILTRLPDATAPVAPPPAG